MTIPFSDFFIGMEFASGDKHWRCTDVGSRVIVAICLEPVNRRLLKDSADSSRYEQPEIQLDADTSWFNGPPYAVSEIVFDEDDIKSCELVK